MEDGRSIRTVTRIDSLIDVGPVTFPAYPDADVSVAQRSFDSYRKHTAVATAAWIEMAQKTTALREYLSKHGR